MNDLLMNAELDYRVNRIREDWRPIRDRRTVAASAGRRSPATPPA